MFRFFLQVAFIRRVLSFPFVRVVLVVIIIGTAIAGLVYASVVFSALSQRSRDPHVHTQHSN
jgi:hypothetical protein